MDRHLIAAAVEAAQMADMRYGVDDCCLWVADIVMAHGGPDLAQPFRGYASQLGAARKLRRYAGGGLLEAAQKRAAELDLRIIRHGWRDGDVGLVTNGAGHLMALLYQDRWLARTAQGVNFTSRSATILAWRLACLH
jgi:hypothetical protein